jgi:hypothetical protein
MKLVHYEPGATFPFDRMARAMGMMGWKWTKSFDVTPEALRMEAARMLEWLQRDPILDGHCSTGGLVVWKNGDVGFESCGMPHDAVMRAWEASA